MQELMNEIEVGNYWNNNAAVWTNLVRAGYDVYRDYLNTPAFFEILPDIKGRKGIDIGCGEGYNSRLLAERGALLEAIDIAPVFIESAKAMEAELPLGVNYSVASATQIPFQSQVFDFATSFMCLMDIPDPEKAIQEIYRVLKPGGFLQFSIEHPCFKTPYLKKLKKPDGKTYAYEVGDYFSGTNGKIDEWLFGNAPATIKNTLQKFKIPTFHKTMASWLNMLIKNGFAIELINEPYPGDEVLQKIPSMQGAQVVSYFLQVRCRRGNG
jgi:ubiquinone/menaquinone biosynthesis C-methylase UbiE